MSANSLSVPFPIFNDIDGDPLDAGYIYIGTANLDPVTNPISVYFDEALTVPAAQPIRTLNGFPSNSGSPARLYVDADDYSITVKNKKGSQVYTSPTSTFKLSFARISGQIPGDRVDFVQSGTGATTQTTQSKLREMVSVKDFGALIDGVTDDYPAVQNAASDPNSIRATDGDYLLSTSVTMTVPKSFVGNGPTTLFEADSSFTGSIFRIAPAAGTDPKGWTVSDFAVTNSGNATNVFLLDIASAGEYISKLTIKNVISKTQVSGYFLELLNSIPNLDGFFTSYISDNWSLGGYYLENAGDSLYLERNTTTGAGVGYYVNQLGTAANIFIRDGNCTSAGGALNLVAGANVVFDGMQVECPTTFTGSNNAAVSVHRPSGGSVYNTKITNNSINTQGNPLYCVYVGNAVGTVIDGNELYCDPATGSHIFLDSGASGTIIGSNKYYSSVTGAEISPIIVNNGVGTVGDWVDATISLSGWTSQGATENPLGFFKDRDGTVHIRGRVAGTPATAGSVLFTLPVGFRPTIKDYQVSLFGAVSYVRGEVIILINATGNVSILTNNTTNIELNSLTFSTK